MKAVELQGLTRRFKDKLAVDHLNLSLEEGELFALEGDALLMGHSIVHEPELAKAQLNVSPQETAVAPNLTVRENLCFIAQLYGSDSRSARERSQRSSSSLRAGSGRALSRSRACRISSSDQLSCGLRITVRRMSPPLLWAVTSRMPLMS